MDDRRDFSLFHPFMRLEQSVHQALKIIRLWTDKMNDLLLIGSRLPDIILTNAIIAVLESRINDPVLKRYQPFFPAEILFFRKLQRCNEFFSS